MEYAAGRYATDLQAKLDHLFAAAEWWPYERRFRIGQALLLYELGRQNAAFVAPAALSLSLLMVTDQSSMQVATSLFSVRKAMGQCAEAEQLRPLIRRVAGSHPTARRVAEEPCP